MQHGLLIKNTRDYETDKEYYKERFKSIYGRCKEPLYDIKWLLYTTTLIMKQVDIEGFEDYQITDDGRVWSKQTNKWLKPFLSDRGYFCVNLYKDGKLKQRKLHNLIAKAFISNPDNKPFIDHIIPVRNGGTNDITNLRWVTQKENCSNPQSVVNRKQSHKGQIPWMKGKHHTEKALEKMSKIVHQFTLDGKLVKVWKSTAECERNGYSSGNVALCCNNRYIREGNNVYKGYVWKYE